MKASIKRQGSQFCNNCTKRRSDAVVLKYVEFAPNDEMKRGLARIFGRFSIGADPLIVPKNIPSEQTF
jgi:hypothetical protein